MDKCCEANMDSRKLDLRSTLYIRSNHPLAFRIIEKILVATPHDTGPFPAQQPLVADPSWALILDICSVEEWPELTSQCRLNGGKTIILVSRHPQPHEEFEAYLPGRARHSTHIKS